MKSNPNEWQSQLDRCEREIAECEQLLRDGHPEVEGLCLALIDWSGELTLLREEADFNEFPGANR
jgi:hypothetical protein